MLPDSYLQTLICKCNKSKTKLSCFNFYFSFYFCGIVHLKIRYKQIEYRKIYIYTYIYMNIYKVYFKNYPLDKLNYHSYMLYL